MCHFRCISDHGREARFPFLDEAVMSFLNSLPIYQKVSHDATSCLLIEFFFIALKEACVCWSLIVVVVSCVCWSLIDFVV